MIRKLFFILAAGSFSFSFLQEKTPEERSLQEFRGGKVILFSGDGAGDAAGIHIQFTYPASWKTTPAGRPEELKRCAQSDESVTAVLTVDKTKGQKPGDMATELKTDMPQTATAGAVNAVTTGGMPGTTFEFSNTEKRVVRSVYSHNLYGGFRYKQYTIRMQFAVVAKPGETNESVDARYSSIAPLFQEMIKCIQVK